MPDERLTKNQRREQAREAARVAREKAKRRDRINSILVRGGVTVGIVAVLAIVAVVIVNSIRPAGPGPLNMASDGIVIEGPALTAVPSTAIPEGGEPVEHEAADFEEPVFIQMWVDYLCPICGAFEQTNAEYIEQLVESEQAVVEVNPVAILERFSAGSRYPTRAANAVACVANYEPDGFWAAHSSLFVDQPAENTTALDNSEIIARFEAAGVESDEVAACIDGGEFMDWAEAATDRAAGDPDLANPASGGFGTPTVFVNGERYVGSVTDAAAFQAFVESFLPAEDETATEE